MTYVACELDRQHEDLTFSCNNRVCRFTWVSYAKNAGSFI
jgi:hypothetical protein